MPDYIDTITIDNVKFGFSCFNVPFFLFFTPSFFTPEKYSGYGFKHIFTYPGPPSGLGFILKLGKRCMDFFFLSIFCAGLRYGIGLPIHPNQSFGVE